MKDKEKSGKLVNDLSLEIIAKSIFKETHGIGFSKSDYIKLVNLLLDKTIDFGQETGMAYDDGVKYQSVDEKVNLPLKGERIIIRDFNEKKDTKIFKKWMDDPSGRFFLLTRVTSRRYSIDELIKNENDILGVITLRDDTPVGLMGFLDFDEENKKAEMRKLVGEGKYRGKGYGKEATKLWIQYGLTNLGLRKIYLNTIEANIRNIRINKELGFKVEGLLHNECFFDDKFHDVLRMGLVV
ncbi:MAG: GNAT family N-acetyltransferase [Melioribacteraceae bacterium]|nr:GNAT family N-acetyltransferase [Melioribacteraceae bacterium]MCF8353292.1 GNAT family N-acetyltransferase [Melioribacteraceae bacterium]MCF8395407.1 GNAT family N-acetyltransferase [Melioribacteraceae bacterium]MCF8418819.1 GNAT family N-acetyltransferase [Melioribacteraceae bacterium]